MRKILTIVSTLVLIFNVGIATTVANEKVGICHATNSETNPYVYEEVSRNALDAHFKHGDYRAEGPEDCATASPAPSPSDEPTPSVEPSLEPEPSDNVDDEVITACVDGVTSEITYGEFSELHAEGLAYFGECDTITLPDTAMEK